MKLFLKYLAVVTLSLIVSHSSARTDDVRSVIKRYEKITRQDKLSEQDVQSVMMDMKLIIKESFHVEMKTVMVAKDTHKIKIDINTLGEQIELGMYGDTVWFSGVPGFKTEIEKIPQNETKQLATMLNVNRYNYLWSNSILFSSEMVGEVEENGKTFQMVQITMNDILPVYMEKSLKDIEGKFSVVNCLVYLDKRTGLVTHSLLNFLIDGEIVVLRTDISEYKKFGKFKLPSVFEMKLDGIDLKLNNGIDLKIILNDIEFNYPITDDMFAIPM